MSIDRRFGAPRIVAWMRVDANGESVSTGETTLLRKTVKEALRKIPRRFRNNLSDQKREQLRVELEAACRMMATRKLLSVIINFHIGCSIEVVDGICFHIDPTSVPEVDAYSLFMRLTEDGEYFSLFGFRHLPEQIALMQKAFHRRGADRE